MNILRTDLQVALNDLHVAAQQSADEYANAAQFVNDETASALFSTVAQEREQLTTKLQHMIESIGDLPTAPDPDRETGQELLQRLHAAFSADQTMDVIQQRLEADEELAKQIEESRDESLSEEYEALRVEFEQHIKTTKTRLQNLK